MQSFIHSGLLDRQFTADRPNQKWIADFTDIWTAAVALCRCRDRPDMQPVGRPISLADGLHQFRACQDTYVPHRPPPTAVGSILDEATMLTLGAF